MSSSTDLARGPDRASRWGGMLVAGAAVSIILAIVLYLTSGAVAPAGASATEIAEGLASAPGQVALMAYLSVPADMALIVGAGLLASRSATTAAGLARRIAWGLVAVSSLLIVQFDLLLPHGLIPLAQGVEEAPLVFEAAYTASNYIHSVGLLFTFVAFLGLFAVEARSQAPSVRRGVAYAALVVWALGIVVSIGLIVERPLLALAPAILVGWGLVAYLGLATAFPKAGSSPPVAAASS